MTLAELYAALKNADGGMMAQDLQTPDPNAKYGNIIPFARGADGQVRMAAPKIAQDAVRAFTTPIEVLRGNIGEDELPEAARNFAGTVAGSGGFMSAPAGSLAMGAARRKAAKFTPQELKFTGSMLPDHQAFGAIPKTSPKLQREYGTKGGELSDNALMRSLQEMEYTYQDRPFHLDEKTLDPQKMEGWLLRTLGDRLPTNRKIKSIDGTPVDVDLDGGPNFMRGDAAKANSQWASTRGPMAGQVNWINDVINETGQPVHSIYTAMGGRSGDSNTAQSETMLQMLRSAKINRADMKKINDTLQENVEGIPNIKNEAKMREFLLSPKTPQKVRRAFFETMAMSPMQKASGIDTGAIRFATTDQDLIGAPTLSGGKVSAKFEKPALLIDPTSTKYPHPGYPYQMAGGEYEGGFAKPVPLQILFPDRYKQMLLGNPDLAKNSAKLGGKFSYGTEAKQLINNEWRDNISRFLEQ